MAPKRLNILKWDGLIKNAFQVKKKKKVMTEVNSYTYLTV